MTDLNTNETKYCTHCGSANKKSAVICAECEKKIANSYRPFYDFLKKHTKDSLSGTVTDTVFSYIKNYLLSHIYGIALSVTIVASAVSTVYGIEPHIEKIADPALPVPVYEEEREEEFSLTQDDFDNFEHLTNNLDSFADMLRSSVTYWEAPDDYASASELYAQNNIPDFNYQGVHELFSNPISLPDFSEDERFYDSDYSHFASDRYTDLSSVTVGGNCTSDIAKTLHADGYKVAECNYILSEHAGTDYSFDTHSGDGYTARLVYRFVFVEYDGKWYIAQDSLIERTGI